MHVKHYLLDMLARDLLDCFQYSNEAICKPIKIKGGVLVKEIVVTTQSELDALPKKFDEYTRIIIKDTAGKWLSVVARGNSSVVAWENSSVVAWGNSSVVAWENSSVVAWENSVVRIFSAFVKILLHGFSVAFLPVTINLNIGKQSKHCHVQIIKDLGWFERNAVEESDKVVLYKRVSVDWKTQENTENETLWLVGSTVEHKAWEPKNSECGGGKFHACSLPYFCDEFRTVKGDRYIAVEINKADLYEWKDNPEYPYKIGFRVGKVLYECDRFGKKVSAVASTSPVAADR